MEDIELLGATTRYVIRQTPGCSGFAARFWGDAGTDLPPEEPLPRQEFDTPEDLAPHEFAVEGTRHVLEVELRFHDQTGERGALMKLSGIEVDDDQRRIRARLRGTLGTPEVDLWWIASAEHDVIRRGGVVRNTSSSPLTLDRALSGAFSMPMPHGVGVDLLAGSWCSEYTPLQATLPRGTFRIESRQGLNSHLVSPALTVYDPIASDRGVWSVALAWPGSFEMNVHATSRAGWVRISAGLLSEDEIVLEPGEELVLPEIQGLWAADADEAARRWHEFQRLELLRSTTAIHRPVSYNSWYATEFEVDIDQQVALADKAAQIGCEMFVLDDGWFQGRISDRAGLGDWAPDRQTFPDGLTPLADRVHELGMRFGLWVEPEGVNPDSELFRSHPDWIHRAKDREPVLIRNQFVLNLGLPEVEEWVRHTLTRILTDTAVDHLKWDMNRAISDGGCPGDPTRSQWSLRHSQAYLRILRWLRAEFPHVTLETCSGGGARVSNAILPFSDVVWPSDETGPRDRLEIQHGFLSMFPATVMSSWVTHLDGVRDGRPASLAFRFLVSMCGVLSVGADLRTWSTQDYELAREMISLYKDLRPIILGGRVHRHRRPREHGYAVEYDQNGHSALFVFAALDDPSPIEVHPHFATQQSTVEVTFGEAHWVGSILQVSPDADAGACLVRFKAGS